MQRSWLVSMMLRSVFSFFWVLFVVTCSCERMLRRRDNREEDAHKLLFDADVHGMEKVDLVLENPPPIKSGSKTRDYMIRKIKK